MVHAPHAYAHAELHDRALRRHQRLPRGRPGARHHRAHRRWVPLVSARTLPGGGREGGEKDGAGGRGQRRHSRPAKVQARARLRCVWGGSACVVTERGGDTHVVALLTWRLVGITSHHANWARRARGDGRSAGTEGREKGAGERRIMRHVGPANTLAIPWRGRRRKKGASTQFGQRRAMTDRPRRAFGCEEQLELLTN